MALVSTLCLIATNINNKKMPKLSAKAFLNQGVLFVSYGYVNGNTYCAFVCRQWTAVERYSVCVMKQRV